MTNSTKRKKNSKFLFVVFFTAFFVLVTFFIANKLGKLKTNNDPRPTMSSSEAKAKLSMVEYSLTKTGTNSVLVSSSNYGFEIVLPYFYKFDTGRGFDKMYPEKETVSLFTTANENKKPELIYAIEIGFLNGRSLDQLAQEEVYGQKRSVNPSIKTTEIEKIDIKLKKTELTINGLTTIKLQFRGAFGADGIVYFFIKGDKYYRISVLRDDGKLFTFTQNQLVEIDQVIRTFKFTSR